MVSTSETGHAKNLANFEKMVSFVSAYGTDYNPTKPSLSLEALQILLADSRNALTAVYPALPPYSNAVAARDVAFKPLNKLVTRVINALKAVDTSPQVDDNVRTLLRKIQGVRAKPKLSDEEKEALGAEGKKVREISASQTSFDFRLENLDKLIKLLSSIPLYVPNENDLKVSSLTALHQDLVSKNSAVIAAAVPLSNVRITRDIYFYKPDTGLVDIAIAVKAYVKSLFGSDSPKFRQVSVLAVRTIKS
jgi:hypothetical protein